MSEKQMVWHAYHAGSLCQYVDIEARRAQIEKIKPERELPTRRRLMKPVVGELPKEFVDACVAYDTAQDAWEAAWDTAQDAWKAAWGTVQDAWVAAWDTVQDAWVARKVSYVKHLPTIEALHAIECPDCPWDGETIFPANMEYPQ